MAIILSRGNYRDFNPVGLVFECQAPLQPDGATPRLCLSRFRVVHSDQARIETFGVGCVIFPCPGCGASVSLGKQGYGPDPLTLVIE